MRATLKTIPYAEDEKTLKLFQEFKALNKQDCLTKEQLIKILMWKSPRPKKYYLANDEKSINEITSLAFATKNESLRIHILTALTGVRIPAASAILMFYDPTKYAVIDIKVWKQLYKAKLVDTNPAGTDFKLNEWDKFLNIVRGLSKEMNYTTRQIEKRLFDLDDLTRRGNVY